MPPTQPLIIKDWSKGIADSPHLGIGLLKNLEIDTFSGAIRNGKKPVTVFHTAIAAAVFTADASTDICTLSGVSVPNTGVAVTFATSGTLPAGLSPGTVYFIIKVNSSTFKVATTIANANAGTQIDITDAGTGTHTMTTVDPGTIMHYAYDDRTAVLFGVDSNNRVWYNMNQANGARLLKGNTLTAGSGNGLAVFRVSDGSATYLFLFRNAAIDVVNVFATANLETPNWSNSWQSMNSGAGSGNSHNARVGQDNIIYFCDDRYVGSILEKAGSVFDPATAGTYTYNNQALDLPLGALTYWLEELGVNLLITVSNGRYLFPWDRTSDSYGLPLPIPEYGGNKMKNVGNVVYILAGRRGNIYQTTGTYVRLFKTLPLSVTFNSTTVQANLITWGGIEYSIGNLIVGVGTGSPSTSISGVYMITPDGRLTVDNTPSTGATNPTAIFGVNEFYQMGYSGGADTMDTSRYSSLESVMRSQLYRVGNKINKASFSRLEVQLAVGVLGSIQVGYRNNTTGAFTTITTFTTGTSDTSYTYDCGLTNLENIQIELQFSAANGGLDIMQVILYP